MGSPPLSPNGRERSKERQSYGIFAAIMREVNDSDTEQTLVASLLDLGLDARVVDDAYVRAGLVSLGLRVERSAIAGRTGLRVTFVDGQGRALATTQARRPAGARPPRGGRRRQPATHAAGRTRPPAVAVGLAAETDDATEGEHNDASPGAPAGTVTPEGANAEEAGPARPRGAIAAWLVGGEASAPAILGLLKQGELSPVAKAVAHKASRRALDAAAQVQGVALDDLMIDGQQAAGLVAASVAFGALIEALSPARVTSTPVLIEMGADPSLLRVLEGARVRERELDFAPSTAWGAALLWAVSHRYGGRGDLIVGAEGTGLGEIRAPDLLHATRASYGPPPAASALDARGGSRELVALLPSDADRLIAADELTRAGADGVSHAPVDTARGPALRISCAAPEGSLDEVTRVLWRHGAEEVRVLDAERRRPECTEVTVAVGRGNKRESVRVALYRDAGRLLRVQPDREDVLAAARLLKVAPGEVHADAVVASRRAVEGDEGE
jgi:uncharacterized protein (DUF111 family)